MSVFSVLGDRFVNSVLDTLIDIKNVAKAKTLLKEYFERELINDNVSKRVQANYEKWIDIIDDREENPDEFSQRIEFKLSNQSDGYENKLLYMLYFAKTMFYYKKDKDKGIAFFYTDIRRLLEEGTEKTTDIADNISVLSDFMKYGLDELNNDLEGIKKTLDSQYGSWDIDFISKVETNNYIEKFKGPLMFEESYYDNDNLKTLIDVYIEPRFTDYENKYDVKNLFSLFKKLEEQFEKDKKNIVLKDTILIEADAGVGKTSFISHLAYNSNNYNIDFEKVYILNFKNMYIENSQIYYYIDKANHEKRNKPIYFDNVQDNSLFIIDSYDECRFTDKENEIFSKFKAETTNKNCKYIVMSRPLNFADNEYIHKCEIKKLNKNEINGFYRKYLNDIQDKPGDIYDDNLKEVLEIPLVLYMYLFNFKNASNEKTISDIIAQSTNLFQVYDNLLGENSYIFTKGETHNSENKPLKENISKVRNSLKKIAFEMYKNGLDLKLTKELKKHRRNTHETKLFDFYLRYNENSNDSSDTITFIHKSFYEYFLSEYFLDRLNEIEDIIPTENNDYEEIYNRYTDIFCTPISSEDSNLLNFIEYHLIADKERTLTNKKYDILLDEIKSSYYDNKYNSNLKYIKKFMLLNCVSKNTIRENIGKDNVHLYFTLLQIILIVTKQAITEKYVDFFEIKELSQLIKIFNKKTNSIKDNINNLGDLRKELKNDLLEFYAYNLFESTQDPELIEIIKKEYFDKILNDDIFKDLLKTEGYTKNLCEGLKTYSLNDIISNIIFDFINMNIDEAFEIFKNSLPDEDLSDDVVIDFFIINDYQNTHSLYTELVNLKNKIFYSKLYINNFDYTSIFTYIDNIEKSLEIENISNFKHTFETYKELKNDITNINKKKNNNLLNIFYNMYYISNMSAISYKIKFLFFDNIDIGKLNLKSINFSNSSLASSNLNYPNLSNINLSGSFLFEADLSKADLSYADLSKADLSYADLSKADLSYADLPKADLSYADLSCANLSYADLSKADLSKVDLSKADLYQTRLKSTEIKNSNLLDTKNLNATYLGFAYINNKSYELMYKTIHIAEIDIDFDSIDFEDVKSEVKAKLKKRGCIGVDEIIDIDD